MVKPNCTSAITKGLIAAGITGGGGESVPSPNGEENASLPSPTFCQLKRGRRDGRDCSRASSYSKAALFPLQLAVSWQAQHQRMLHSWVILSATAGTWGSLQYCWLQILLHAIPLPKQKKSGLVQTTSRKNFLLFCFWEQVTSGVVSLLMTELIRKDQERRENHRPSRKETG